MIFSKKFLIRQHYGLSSLVSVLTLRGTLASCKAEVGIRKASSTVSDSLPRERQLPQSDLPLY